MNNFQDKANFIWQVADDILRGTFKQHEYGDVILPAQRQLHFPNFSDNKISSSYLKF